MNQQGISPMDDGPRCQCALVPVSADPITFGHLDIVSRAAAISERAVLLVCDNDNKRDGYLFTLQERVAMATAAVRLAGLDTVEIMASSGLLADVALRENADCIVRGVRSERDLAEDQRQEEYHSMVWSGMNGRFRYLTANDGLRNVSSTLVKAFVRRGVDVSCLVPAFVKAALEARMRGVWPVGVTGGIASGKTYVCRSLTELLRQRGAEVQHVDFDEIVRQIYREDSPGARALRQDLAILIGHEVLDDDGRMDPMKMRDRLFGQNCSDELRRQAHELMVPHVWRAYREHTAGLHGILLVEWAKLAEMGMGGLVNHCVIAVQSPDRETLLDKRGINRGMAESIMSRQVSEDERLTLLGQAAAKNGFGWVVSYINRLDDQQSLGLLADELKGRLPPAFTPRTEEA